jgi:amino acid transporter
MENHTAKQSLPTLTGSHTQRVLVATTAMLAFISFWRAAAIVLNDMGSSAFYAGAIAEHFVGKAAPWFILAIMLLSYAVRSVYIESCSMFVRGGVYRVVKEAMGGTLAKFSVSALMFDYILTGPISGVSAGLYLVGPLSLRLAFRAFVVVVGVLMLAGAVNTAIVGSNGVLNRVSEDGILPYWFRRPQRRFGTSYRILNLVVGLQLLTIFLSRGNIFLLGEAYAFGVMWSFAMKGLAVLVLRYKQPGKREFRVPLNLMVGGVEIPVGLGLITVTLVALCVINLFTKQIATLSGVAFTIIFFVVF